MRSEEVNDLAIFVLVIVAALLIADCVWLHVKCARLDGRVQAQTAEVAALGAKLERHVNPPQEQAKPSVYERMKAAAVKGYEAAKKEYSK